MLPKEITQEDLNLFTLIVNKITKTNEFIEKNAALLGEYQKPTGFFHLIIYHKKVDAHPETIAKFFNVNKNETQHEFDNSFKLIKKLEEIYFNNKLLLECYVLEATNLGKNSKQIIQHIFQCCSDKKFNPIVFKNTSLKPTEKELLLCNIAEEIITTHFAVTQ